METRFSLRALWIHVAAGTFHHRHVLHFIPYSVLQRLDLQCCWSIDAIVNSCGCTMWYIFVGATLDSKQQDQGISKGYTLPRLIEWTTCECYFWRNYTGLYGTKRSTRVVALKATSLRQCAHIILQHYCSIFKRWHHWEH